MTKLTVSPDRVENRKNFQCEESTAGKTSDHGRSDPLHDLCPRTVRPKKGQEARCHGGDGHDLRPKASHRSLGVSRHDVVVADDAGRKARRKLVVEMGASQLR